jgi:hypothetical protein
MADGTLGGLGSSIGLTATPKDYSSLYKYNQQLKAQQEKAKQDKLDDIIKNVTVKAGEDLHRLEVEPMRIRTAAFIDKARQSVGQDDMSGFYDELTRFQADLNLAKSRSAGYNGLEKTVREAASGNKYVPKNVRQAASLMLNSATSADYIGALADNQIKQNAFFDYDEQGNVMTQSFDAYDINKAVKDMIAGNSVVVGRGKEVYDPYTKTKSQPYIKGIPYDDNEAAQVKNMVDEKGFLVRPIMTASQIPEKLLSNSALAAQYIDMYDLENMTPEQVQQHFMENVVDPNVKLKESVQTTKKSGDINISNQQGTAAQYAFIGAPKAKLNFMEEGKLEQINSLYSVQLAVGGDLTFQFSPSGAMISKDDNKPYSLVGSSDLKANYIHILPYIEIDGVKRVISEASAKAAYGGKVKYAPFVEGKVMDFTVQPNVSNPDYYTEFTTDILGGFANNAATKGKQASAAFAEGIKQLNKKLVSVGARPVGAVR